MDPKIWGRNMWTSLLNIIKGYPELPDPNIQQSYRVFLVSLGSVLPCDACKVNYRNHIRDLPPDLRNRQTAIEWLHQIHNRTLLQTKRAEITLDQFLQKYDNIISHQPQKNQQLIVVFLIILIGLVYYYVHTGGGKTFFLKK